MELDWDKKSSGAGPGKIGVKRGVPPKTLYLHVFFKISALLVREKSGVFWVKKGGIFGHFLGFLGFWPFLAIFGPFWGSRGGVPGGQKRGYFWGVQKGGQKRGHFWGSKKGSFLGVIFGGLKMPTF